MQPVRVRSPSTRAALTSQQATSMAGAAGGMGLRANGAALVPWCWRGGTASQVQTRIRPPSGSTWAKCPGLREVGTDFSQTAAQYVVTAVAA